MSVRQSTETQKKESPRFRCYETRSPALADEARISHWKTTPRDLSALMLPYLLGACMNLLKKRSYSFRRILCCCRPFFAL